MSRSKRKPYCSMVTHSSNKIDKRFANKRFRRKNKQNLLHGKELLYKIREVSDIFLFDSDGELLYAPTNKYLNDTEFLNKIKRK